MNQQPQGLKVKKAITGFLHLDTGLRASELCALRVEDVDMKSGKASVRAGEAGKAKGGKGRSVFLSRNVLRIQYRLADRSHKYYHPR